MHINIHNIHVFMKCTWLCFSYVLTFFAEIINNDDLFCYCFSSATPSSASVTSVYTILHIYLSFCWPALSTDNVSVLFIYNYYRPT